MLRMNHKLGSYTQEQVKIPLLGIGKEETASVFVHFSLLLKTKNKTKQQQQQQKKPEVGKLYKEERLN